MALSKHAVVFSKTCLRFQENMRIFFSKHQNVFFRPYAFLNSSVLSMFFSLGPGVNRILLLRTLSPFTSASFS